MGQLTAIGCRNSAGASVIISPPSSRQNFCTCVYTDDVQCMPRGADPNVSTAEQLPCMRLAAAIGADRALYRRVLSSRLQQQCTALCTNEEQHAFGADVILTCTQLRG